MSQANGIPSYYFWISQAQRYQAAVDFGSPISAWTSEMIKEHLAKQKEAYINEKK